MKIFDMMCFFFVFFLMIRYIVINYPVLMNVLALISQYRTAIMAVM